MDNRMMDGTKFLYHVSRAMDYFDHGERIAPVHIDCGIAKFCNVKCVWCYGLHQTPSKEYIQREPLLQLVRDAKEIGVKSLAWIGDGEPTCNPHCFESLALARDLGLDMSMSTSGVLLDTEEKMTTALEACVWLRFCLGAGDREGYKKLHGVDRFDTVVQNVENLLEIRDKKNLKCDVGLQTVFIPMLMNQDVVKEAELAVKLGVDYFVVKQCSLPDDGESGMYQFDLSDYDRPEVVDALRRAEDMSNDTTNIIVKWNVISLKGRKDYRGCPGIPLLSEISGNGDWMPCGYMFGDPKYDEYKFGNLHDKSLKEIWESDRYWEIVEKMACIDTDTFCQGCCRQDPLNYACDHYRTMRNAALKLGLELYDFQQMLQSECKLLPEVAGVNFL